MFRRIPAFTNWTIEPLSGQLLQMFFVRMFVELFGSAKSFWAILTCHSFSGTGLFQGRVVEGVLVVLQDVGGRVVTFTDVTLNPILDDVLQVFWVCMFEEVLGVDQGDIAVLTDYSLWRHFINQKKEEKLITKFDILNKMHFCILTVGTLAFCLTHYLGLRCHRYLSLSLFVGWCCCCASG